MHLLTKDKTMKVDIRSKCYKLEVVTLALEGESARHMTANVPLSPRPRLLFRHTKKSHAVGQSSVRLLYKHTLSSTH